MKKWTLIWLVLWIPLAIAGPTNWDKYKRKTIARQQQIVGWCSPEKAEKLMDLIHETGPKVCVEIGVFGGASVFPMAAALKFQNNGLIYGIDPWSAEDCREGFAEDDANALWWSSLDHEKIYRDFLKVMERHKLDSYTRVMRMNSKTAVLYFENDSIDILHIDGNHSAEVSLGDVKMFYPKLKTGGYLWFDDADWHETTSTVRFLKEGLNLELDLPRSVGNHCLLFKKL